MDRTLHSRFEIKYLVDPGLVPVMRSHLETFMRLDPYSNSAENHQYGINSLYLDGPGLELCNQTRNAEKNRFKLRIRSYTDSPRVPLFFEIKRRVNQVILKDRNAVERQVAEAYIATMRERKETHSAIPDGFREHVAALRARPITQVRYKREAWEAKSGDPVRVTFDTGLQRSWSPNGELSFADSSWDPVPLNGTILELKFTERFPGWVGEFVDTFSLKRQSVAKYLLSIKSLEENHALRTSMGLHDSLRTLSSGGMF